MRLSVLIQGLPVERFGSFADVEISGLAHDSRRVRPGDLFAAWKGLKHDGRAFAAEAVARGAVAVLSDGPAPEGVPGAIPWLLHETPRLLLGPLARRLYAEPDRKLGLVGVTGTNGKTTTTTLIALMLEKAGHPAGLLGTLGYRFAGTEYGKDRTTPEASDLFRMLAEMHAAGAEYAVMEVSSHALEQGRVAGAEFAVAAFTNLTRDHFDFHPTFDDYFAAKRRLFDQLGAGGKAVVNQEDPYGRTLARQLAARPGTLTFGVGGEVSIVSSELSGSGSRVVIQTPRGPLHGTTKLLGRYNLLNILAAVAVGEALGLPHGAMAEAIATLKPLPGRLEPVELGQSFPVYIDYAHTDGALDAAVSSAKEFSGRRVILVFGCGGDRDPGKRPLMGRAAAKADVVILTSDNPRSEDPLAILEQAEIGLRESQHRSYEVIADRRAAIARAIAVADEGSLVLVAGKGHEQVQIFADRVVPFSDLDAIKEALEEKLGHPLRR